MTKTCAYCGRPFQAVRRAAKFCGDACRQRARRHPEVVGLPRSPSGEDTELLDLVRRQLHDLGAWDTWAGWCAEKLAVALCDPHVPAGALVPLSRELVSVLAEVRFQEPPTSREVDEIRRLRAGGSR